MQFLTQFYYEKDWVKVSEKEVLDLIAKEFPDVPAEGTFEYLKSECQKGKTVTIGESRFKIDKN